MLTPYQLAFTARISVILLPWAALPWLVGLTARALERRGWRDPVLFALVALAAGSVNATALLLVGLAPLLWLVVAVAQRRATPREAGLTALRIAVPTVALSIWWAVGLVTQARYGLPVLDVTESLRTVAGSSTPSDLLRGFGNWFLSGSDRAGPWLDQSVQYADEKVLAALTFALPFAALVGAAFMRWKHRAYFVAIIVVGTIVGVGAWPYDDPSPIGQLFKDGSIGSSIALALRNTPASCRSSCSAWPGCSVPPCRHSTDGGASSSVRRCSSVSSPSVRSSRCGGTATSPTTSSAPRPCRSTGRRPRTHSTARAMRRACSRSRARSSRRTAGATRSSP